MRGELTQSVTLPPTLVEFGTVITTANAIGRALGGEKNLTIEAVDRQGNEALLRAAEAAEVRRFM